ncbi:uncharacterized protein LOC111707318 [Eurytemora carolleeae]|uniref:uncharacterized protein LOC111707318 n=1 Tax=Eurytemora carolleeae TaxID=1294199 RepID=UPI000C7653AD|nr:uncharacterized protein LOC111707318 [Eurytemora carolleeae]|eukprot:XP_023336169.1 uncharacterized protein LOC111707318 [Eurytemora affinis]
MIRAVLLSALLAGAMAGLVKRDTADDIQESLGNMFNSNKNPSLDDFQEGGLCITDSQCVEHLQFCNRENPLNMHCQYVVWVWVGVGVLGAVLLLTVLGSCFCCSCCCLSSLCRKK